MERRGRIMLTSRFIAPVYARRILMVVWYGPPGRMRSWVLPVGRKHHVDHFARGASNEREV